ncbi:3-hydroxyacyl-CoA dehydrogenase family protein [Lentilactobacillus diolivorans]|uniref:L-gulonate 3-dehydrogenase n=2 Tax=Lentilactobacillus diolivorans TaxID=179838 RepID=A0A0R1SKB2_9LACO|nr:3-hydroxyacyl-CoA dehydrogenase family protein [Lentilactobacillus diolivorans]KRL69500.1 3-hydroxyacyl-CoA dehydrogenase [Lentilactobacillus diolivorans DSM 14421]GEP23823.1 butyryl-CoA dehydrogenase [Lentilactobacillus diolivorans]
MDSLKLSDIKTIANIGAGTMGHATALQFAMYGYHVYLLDTTQKALNHGLDLIKHDLQTFLGANIVQADEETDILARIIPTTDYQKAISKADFVIESIVEDLTVKQLVWQKVEQFASDETVFATNTSGLSPTAIQSKLHHPERLVVAHFWNPAQLMPLVEVVPGNLTNEATITLTTALMNHVGKHAIALKRESLGFVGNRIQLAVLREAFKIVKDGIADPAAVDDIIKYSLGRRWSLVGPIASADLGGLDVFKNISSYLYADLASEQETDPLLEKMVDEGRLGLKSGEGFFDWQGDKGKEIVAQRDQKLLDMVKSDKKLI